MWNFFNSNLFVGLITFFVGSFAIYLYKKQKDDYKRDIAMSILVEIRNAEDVLEKIHTGQRSPNLVLIPLNNWNKYNYLFINDFDFDELNLINDFLTRCSIIDKALPQLSYSYQIAYKANSIQEALTQLAKECTDKEDYTQKRNKLIEIIGNESYTFVPGAPNKDIDNAISNLRYITTSSAGSKLKKLTTNRKFFIL